MQLIDSLDAGGAESIALSYANALQSVGEFSALVSTRKGGVLLPKLNAEVVYLNLDKKRAFDLKALIKLIKFSKAHRIEIVHAHGTSYFTAILLKILHPRIKVVWHEHLGSRVGQKRRENLALYICSMFFSMILVVNPELEIWMRKNLLCRNVSFIPNYSTLDQENSTTQLNGERGKRIVLVANLKNPKNHLFALRAFAETGLSDAGWSLHFIGKDFGDDYVTKLQDYISKYRLSSVYFYGQRTDISNILFQATIGILASTDEGFPITLLEYGTARLPVISTNAGYCNTLIQHGTDGFTFDPSDLVTLKNVLIKLAGSDSLRQQFAVALYNKVAIYYSEATVINTLLTKYRSI